MSLLRFTKNRFLRLQMPVMMIAAIVTGHARAEAPSFYAQPFGLAGELQSGSLIADPSARYFTGINYEADDGSVTHAWGADIQAGTVHEIGLFGDGVHIANLGYAFGLLPTSNGLVTGVAMRNDGQIANFMGSENGPSISAWVSNLNTGETTQIGLYDPAHQLVNTMEGATGPAYFNLGLISTNSGHVLGAAINNTTEPAALTYDEPSLDSGQFTLFAEGSGQSIWVAEAATGDTQRFGLIDSAHTVQTVMDGETTVVPGGFQATTITGTITESGFLAGLSMQFNYVAGDDETVHVGTSAWVGYTETGKTYRVGLTDAQHTSGTGTVQAAFVEVDNSDVPGGGLFPAAVTSDGFVAGNSINYTAGGTAGLSAWVAGYDAVDDRYVTTRTGFFGTDAGGIYQRADGLEVSETTHFTESGLAGGYSEMLGLAGSGQSAWVTDAHTLTRTEVGLLGSDYTAEGGYRENYLDYLNNAGVAAGTSALFHETGGNEDVDWVQKVASSVDGNSFASERIGLLTEADSTQRSAEVDGITQSGIVYGSTLQTLASEAITQDAWVSYADGAHYTTDRVGLSGEGFEHPEFGDRASTVGTVTESGVALGASERYYSPDGGTTIESDTALWVATRQPSAHYETTRVGLFDANHTKADGSQSSSFYTSLLTKSGYIGGTSTQYGTANATGQSVWVVDTADAVTRQVGLTDATHTNSVDGTHNGWIDGITESGYVWGGSDRYIAGGSDTNGETAWVYAFSDHSLHSFELSADLVGYAHSQIYGVTESGIAYGGFEKFDASGVSEGFRAFGWTLAGGVFVLEDVVINDLSGYDWGALSDALYVTEDGRFIGQTESGELFTTTAVPEPSACAMLAGAAALGWVIVRRRRVGK